MPRLGDCMVLLDTTCPLHGICPQAFDCIPCLLLKPLIASSACSIVFLIRPTQPLCVLCMRSLTSPGALALKRTFLNVPPGEHLPATCDPPDRTCELLCASLLSHHVRAPVQCTGICATAPALACSCYAAAAPPSLRSLSCVVCCALQCHKRNGGVKRVIQGYTQQLRQGRGLLQEWQANTVP